MKKIMLTLVVSLLSFAVFANELPYYESNDNGGKYHGKEKLPVEKSELNLSPGVAEIPISSQYYNDDYTVTKFNVLIGKYMYSFMLDVSLDENCIFENGLQKLGISLRDENKDFTMYIKEMNISGNKFNNVKVAACPEKDDSLNDVDGTLGLSFFSKIKYISFDFTNSRILLNKFKPITNPLKLNVVKGEGFLTSDVKVNDKKCIALLVPGMFSSYINDSKSERYPDGKLQSISFENKASTTPVKFENQNVYFLPEDKDEGKKIPKSIKKKSRIILGNNFLYKTIFTVELAENNFWIEQEQFSTLPAVNSTPSRIQQSDKPFYIANGNFGKFAYSENPPVPETMIPTLPSKMEIAMYDRTGNETHQFLDMTFGTKKIKMLLDTGAPASCLYYSGLSKIGINPKETEADYFVYFKEINIQGYTCKNVRFETSFNRTDITDYDGLLGLDFFKNTKSFTLDYKNKFITINDFVPTKDYSKFTNYKGHIIVEDVTVDGKMCKVFLDSGSNYNNCDNSKLNLPQIEEQKGSTLSETLYAKTEVEIYYYVVPEIEINNAVLKNVSVYLLGKDDWQKKMGKGSSFY